MSCPRENVPMKGEKIELSQGQLQRFRVIELVEAGRITLRCVPDRRCSVSNTKLKSYDFSLALSCSGGLAEVRLDSENFHP